MGGVPVAGEARSPLARGWCKSNSLAARFFAKHLAKGGALAFRWCAHGARTAKLLRTWHVRSIGFPVAWSLSVSRFAKGRAACATALRPKARQLLCRWLSAQPFCRARPVRAPLAGKCLRTWQSAPQGRAALRLAMCEALAFRWQRRPKARRFSPHPLPTPHSPQSHFFQKTSPIPLRLPGNFAILSPSADEPGSRKERELFVLLGGLKEKRK